MTTERKAFDGWSGLPVTGKPARVALIGVSGYGRVYLDLLREAEERGGVKLVTAAIINTREESATIAELRAQGCEIFTDFRDMLTAHHDAVDLCCIPTGIAWHTQMTVAALAARANVLVEKPLAGSVDDAQAIRAAERAADRFVAVGFQDIYSPETGWLKEWLLAGKLGRLRAIHFSGQWPRDIAYYTRNDWAGRLHAGGIAVFDSPLNNAFAHFAHLGLWLAGPTRTTAASPTAVQAELWRSHAIESCDTALLRARLSTGVELTCTATHSSSDVRDPEIVIEGSAGTAHWNYERDCVLTLASGERMVRPLPSAMESRRYMFSAVLRRLMDPKVEICDTASAEQHTALIAAMHAAAEIKTVPPERIEWLRRHGDNQGIPTIRGLADTLGGAWANLPVPSDSSSAAGS